MYIIFILVFAGNDNQSGLSFSYSCMNRCTCFNVRHTYGRLSGYSRRQLLNQLSLIYNVTQPSEVSLIPLCEIYICDIFSTIVVHTEKSPLTQTSKLSVYWRHDIAAIRMSPTSGVTEGIDFLSRLGLVSILSNPGTQQLMLDISASPCTALRLY